MASHAQSIDKGYSHNNLRHVVITSTTFAFLLSTTAVAFRIVSRKVNGTGLFLDDIFIILGLIFEWGISVAGVVLLYNGLGTHIVYVPPEHLVVYLKTLFTGSILFTCCIACIKLSVLMLYRRLFPTKYMIKAVNIVASIVVLWAFGGILAGCFACIPTEKLWHPQLPGGCFDLSRFYYGLQIPNILTDAIILFMPMHVVWNLPISRTQKFGLSALFVLGFLTLVFDIVRLVSLMDLSRQGKDITYNQVGPSVWTCIEPAVGIVAACLSNMRPLFRVVHEKCWKRIVSTGHSSQEHIVDSEKGSWSRQTATRSVDTVTMHSTVDKQSV